nr:hypothetical protein KS05_33410 [Rhizobium brockwellii]
MSSQRDITDPFVARAIELQAIFHRDAVERDKKGGRPIEQIRLLKETTCRQPRSRSATADKEPPGCRSCVSCENLPGQTARWPISSAIIIFLSTSSFFVARARRKTTGCARQPPEI